MNKKTLLILCLIFVAVMIGAAVLYSALSEGLQPVGLVTTPPETQSHAESQIPTETSAEDPTEVTDTQPTDSQDHTAPDFTMLDLEWNEVTLASFVGKPIVLNFWASWCGPCKSEMPEIQEFYEQYGENVQFILVSVDDSLETAKKFIEDEGYTFPVYFDNTSLGGYSYGASSIPLTYFIDTDGQMVAYFRGAMSESILQQGIDLIYRPEQAE